MILIAAFAEKYKNIGLSSTMSMYSLFELSPFDMPTGIDEKQDNFNNLIIDDKYRIIGLFDFNMSGTDVIVNYLANNALLESYFLTEEFICTHTAEQIYDAVIGMIITNTDIIREHYTFSDQEKIKKIK